MPKIVVETNIEIIPTEVWCSYCGHRFDHVDERSCPECGHDCLVITEGAELCSRQDPNPCDRPAADPKNGLHMCAECGDAYMHGF